MFLILQIHQEQINKKDALTRIYIKAKCLCLCPCFGHKFIEMIWEYEGKKIRVKLIKRFLLPKKYLYRVFGSPAVASSRSACGGAWAAGYEIDGYRVKII